MAPKKNQNPEWTGLEADWDSEVLWKQALIDPQARREQEAEEKVKEEAAAKSKPPEPTAEEQSKKLTELHARMEERIKRLVEGRYPEQGPKESK
ncbi:hypothetical protein COL26b_001802 [Colletotrichum chrysophilum]|uniref:uncharacterized protein n=1 Tax=Colletotrichum chrysophilum TaxID=1836956 RepID=UPI0023005437|nr:uncharacterized protein COL26b_001802 [Colletotrichum chrysophilum]KAJ0379985.1 hypothetical protein COL26b_001802 [Colletotrichum chrysophilum]